MNRIVDGHTHLWRCKMARPATMVRWLSRFRLFAPRQRLDIAIKDCPVLFQVFARDLTCSEKLRDCPLGKTPPWSGILP